MMITNDVEEFLNHHGVKGQQWGVRRQSRLDRRAGKIDDKLSGMDQKYSKLLVKRDRLALKSDKISSRRLNPGMSRKTKVLLGAAGVAAIGAGALYANKVIGSKGKLPISSIRDMVKFEGDNFKIRGEAHSVNTIMKELALRNIAGLN